MEVGDLHLWERLVTWTATNWPILPLAGLFWWFHMRPLRDDMRYVRRKLVEMQKQLDVHEAKCEERWKDAYRRLDNLEREVKGHE